MPVHARGLAGRRPHILFVDIQQIAPPALLGYATSTCQALAYVGFTMPYLLSLSHAVLGWSAPLGLLVTSRAVSGG